MTYSNPHHHMDFQTSKLPTSSTNPTSTNPIHKPWINPNLPLSSTTHPNDLNYTTYCVFSNPNKEDFVPFLQLFEYYAQIKNWTTQLKTHQFPTCLKGEAYNFYTSLPTEIKSNYKLLIALCLHKFQRNPMTPANPIEYNSQWKQQSNESCQDCEKRFRRQATKRLQNKPVKYSETTFENGIKDIFIKTQPNAIRIPILLSSPKTLKEAIVQAKILESQISNETQIRLVMKKWMVTNQTLIATIIEKSLQPTKDTENLTAKSSKKQRKCYGQSHHQRHTQTFCDINPYPKRQTPNIRKRINHDSSTKPAPRQTKIQLPRKTNLQTA